jgi:hypothetical protein
MILHYAKISAVLVAATWGSQTAIENKEALIEKYPPAVQQTYKNYIAQYKSVKKLQDFVRVYQTIDTHEEKFSAPLQAVWEKYWLATDNQKPGQSPPVEPKFDWVDAAFPGMILGNEAEGTIMILRPSWKSLAALAKQTTDSTQDDRFIALMLKLHGDYWSGYPEWMQQTWDYGGCSRLGSGKHTAFLKEIQIQIKGGSAFKSTLRDQENYLISDLLSAEELCHSKANALKELSQMEKQFSWSTQQKQAIAKQRQRINTGKVRVINVH